VSHLERVKPNNSPIRGGAVAILVAGTGRGAPIAQVSGESSRCTPHHIGVAQRADLQKRKKELAP
jgi:hypothetical protein